MFKKITTSRLTLRRWLPKDHEPFAKINSDPRVMEFMTKTLSRQESDAFIERIESHFSQHGFGLYAAEESQSARLIGFIGFSIPKFESHFTPCVEIGWRLGFESWGQGYATEGAKAVLNLAFTEFDLKEIVSFTVPLNLRSIKVMEKIGMTNDSKDDFDHPLIADNSPLKHHVLYRLKNQNLKL